MNGNLFDDAKESLMRQIQRDVVLAMLSPPWCANTYSSPQADLKSMVKIARDMEEKRLRDRIVLLYLGTTDRFYSELERVGFERVDSLGDIYGMEIVQDRINAKPVVVIAADRDLREYLDGSYSGPFGVIA